jgi:hypothetical protein
MNSTSFPTFSFRELAKVISVNLNSGTFQAVMMFAAPGSGKTVFATKYLPQILADFHGIDVADVGMVVEKPARRKADEMAGVAMPIEANAEDSAIGFAEGDWYTDFTVSPIIVKIRKTRKEVGILVLDEAGQAGNPEQKLLSDCFDADEHAIGGSDLPRSWIVVGTANRTEDKAGSFKILSQNIDRVLPANIVVPVQDWIEDFCIPNNINPIVQECALAYADSGFFADAVPAGQEVFNTRRSTVRASKHLDAFMASPEFDGTIPRWMEKMLAGNMGNASAKILVDYIARRDMLPTAADIMGDPDGCMVPDQTGFQMIAANIAMAQVRDVRTATAALKYICRLRQDLQVSLGVKLMTISSKAGWLVSDPVAHEFIGKFQEFLPLAWSEMK